MIILLGMALFASFPIKTKEQAFFKKALFVPLFSIPVYILLEAAKMNEPSYVRAVAAGALSLCITSVIVKWALLIFIRRSAPKKYRDTFVVRERHIQVALLLPSLVICIFVTITLL